MYRKCNCSGVCGPKTDGVTRREFITLVGAGAAGALLMHPGAVWGDAAPATSAELTQWLRDLHVPGALPIYRSGQHPDARFPLGGIGTGNIEIGPDGQFLNWQLFNTLRDGFVPLFFAVRVGDTTRLLQTDGGPGMPRISQIEMTGQYPMADLRFHDPALPIELSLSAFSPFAPLDTALSSLPVVCLVFKAHNATKQAQTVSLAGLIQNPIGYDAMGAGLDSNSTLHADFGANVNTVSQEGAAAILTMRALPSPLPTLARPLHIYTNIDVGPLNGNHAERPSQIITEDLAHLSDGSTPPPVPEDKVVLLEEIAVDFPEQTLRLAHDAVANGATLIFSGKMLPLVQAYHLVTSRNDGAVVNRDNLVFDDFEGGYDHWTVEGTAFGSKPSTGTLPNQGPVSGFQGKGLINSYLEGDAPTGRLISKTFPIERNFIRFLIGGGTGPGTQLRLVIDGKTVRAASGRESEQLFPVQWDVREFTGQQAHLEIVDEETGPWGHVLVDEIEFSDGLMTPAVFKLLHDLLGHMPLEMPKQQTMTFGKGRVVVLTDSILTPDATQQTGARQKAYATVAGLVGIDYAAPKGPLGTAPGYGTMTLATLGANPTALTSFDDFGVVIKQFETTGSFAPLSEAVPNTPTPEGQTINGALASTVTIAPGATVEVPFLLTWHYPNKYNGGGQWMGNHYTHSWPDAKAVTNYAAANFKTLHDKTETFRRTFYDSTLPLWMLDCVSSQISTIRHIGVVFRIANGDIYGWEGANGCCDPTCTHVWGYEQTLSRLFPDLEREMRRIDLDHQQRPDGGINNRTDVPSPPHPSGQDPFTDGHASTVLKAYREIRNSSDPGLLKRYWPSVKRAVDYLIARDAAASGGKPTGTLSDGQANTYDNTIHGVNSFIGTYYLAALRAGEEMALLAGDHETAQHFRSVFETGRTNLDTQCWNGEYYQQNLADYLHRGGEYGPGCFSDQLIGQWWAHQLDLGYLLPKERVRTALRSVYRYNWLPDFSNFHHNMRQFVGGKDKGLLICTWPKGGRPNDPIPYVDEVWTGVEYQVAGHMLYEGLIDEGFAIVKGARERYDGIPRSPIPRSPWNEYECGGHYARAMASWSLLLAMSGFSYDSLSQTLRFKPLEKTGAFKSFFSSPEGWGSLTRSPHEAGLQHTIHVVSGQVTVTHLQLAADAKLTKAKVGMGTAVLNAHLTHNADGVLLTFTKPITVKANSSLTVTLT